MSIERSAIASKCTALTLKGTQCTRKSKDGTVCGMHMKVETSILLKFEQINSFSVEDLLKYKDCFEKDYLCELINLNEALPSYDDRRTEEAYVLIVRNFHDKKIDELENLNWEKQKILRKKLVNRRDHYGLNITNIPILLSLQANLKPYFKVDDCQGLYFFCHDAGYKYHGDMTNNIYVNFGTTNLYFQWFFNRHQEGENVNIKLNNDLILMSEKAMGKDCKKKGTPILKYAIGEKYR